jgi:prepilin-type N-terminal cleavage/methylation domain-containing protein
MTLGSTTFTMASPPKGDDRDDGTPTRLQTGFSLIEIVVVLAVVGILLSIGFMSIDRIMPRMRAEQAARQVAAMMREGRALAMTRRRNIEVDFIDGTKPTMLRWELSTPPSALPPLAPLPSQPLSGKAGSEWQAVELTGGSSFIPCPGPDTPDGFGNAAAVSFGNASVTNVQVAADGFIERTPGELMNGTVFVGIPGRDDTIHAVTVRGATGRVRIWRWNPNIGLWTKR